MNITIVKISQGREWKPFSEIWPVDSGRVSMGLLPTSAAEMMSRTLAEGPSRSNRFCLGNGIFIQKFWVHLRAELFTSCLLEGLSDTAFLFLIHIRISDQFNLYFWKLDIIFSYYIFPQIYVEVRGSIPSKQLLIIQNALTRNSSKFAFFGCWWWIWRPCWAFSFSVTYQKPGSLCFIVFY